MIEIRITGHIELTRQFDEEGEALAFLKKIKKLHDVSVKSVLDRHHQRYVHNGLKDEEYYKTRKAVLLNIPIKIEITTIQYRLW